MKTMFVQPTPGLKIRMPDNPAEHLSAAGAEVPANSFWLRRLRDGSVVKVTQPKGAAKK